MFMSTHEIDRHFDLYHEHPVIGPAVKFLADFRDMVNANSDGWTYWSAATKAAERLMKIIHDYDQKRHVSFDRNPAPPVTLKDVEKAIVPIKALCTKHEKPCPLLSTASKKISIRYSAKFAATLVVPLDATQEQINAAVEKINIPESDNVSYIRDSIRVTLDNDGNPKLH